MSTVNSGSSYFQAPKGQTTIEKFFNICVDLRSCRFVCNKYLLLHNWMKCSIAIKSFLNSLDPHKPRFLIQCFLSPMSRWNSTYKKVSFCPMIIILTIVLILQWKVHPVIYGCFVVWVIVFDTFLALSQVGWWVSNERFRSSEKRRKRSVTTKEERKDLTVDFMRVCCLRHRLP